MGDTVDPVELARVACEAARIDPSGLRMIRHYSNAVVLVPSVGAVARVAIGRHDRWQIRRSLHVTRWLHGHHGYPTVVPLDDVDVVAVTPEASVSFWEYLPPTRPARTVRLPGRSRWASQVAVLTGSSGSPLRRPVAQGEVADPSAAGAGGPVAAARRRRAGMGEQGSSRLG